MLYPVYIHPGDDNHAHSVTIPDFPGCFSAADDWNQLSKNVQEAIELYCDGEDMNIPDPTPLDKLIDNQEYSNGIWMLIDIDTNKLNTKKVRLNISLPANIVAKMDAYASKHHMTRSALIAKASTDLIDNEINQ